ncbi:MAG: hypothetical protein O2816_02255 [Planctomycetota bacterium]|nr:hypothetical protein [Planctomycetota bacterium]
MRAPLIALLLIGSAWAQDAQLEARVVQTLGEQLTLDRGTDSGVEPGDRVQIVPVVGATREGTVESVAARECWVSLEGSAAVPPGTRAVIYVPAARLEAEGDDYEWEGGPVEWDTDMPLLAEVSSPAPKDREREVRGRWYVMAEWVDDAHYDQEYAFARAGLDLEIENPFGRGGELEFDGEFLLRSADVQDDEDSDDSALRIDRLSYVFGGRAGSQRRYAYGRFLQAEVPEFGVLDGVQVVQQLASGDRFGVSAGLMPETREDLATGDDVQAAVFYRHVRGPREELSFVGAYQKTWHAGRADRDLVLAGARWYPGDGWSAWGSAWIDLYGSEDTLKGSGAELTRLSAGFGKTFGSTGGLHATLSEYRFPELLRNESNPASDGDLAHDRTQRLSLSGWRRVTERLRLNARLDRWSDESDSGSGGELGLQVRDWGLGNSRFSIALTHQQGLFGDISGLRATYGRYGPGGAWGLTWQSGTHETPGFFGQQASLDQDRLRLFLDRHTRSGWDLSVYLEQRSGDEQDSLLLGFYLQRGF